MRNRDSAQLSPMTFLIILAAIMVAVSVAAQF